MSTSFRFFATPNDLLSVLRIVEENRPIKYVQAGRFSAREPVSFIRGQEIPNVGIASHESSIASTTYLICCDSNEIRPRELSGNLPFAFDQLENPKTILLTPGGWWNDDILIRGSCGTASNDLTSLELMKLFRSAFRKRSTTVKGVYLGPEAEKFWRQGKRLTGAEQSPPEFDLHHA